MSQTIFIPLGRLITDFYVLSNRRFSSYFLLNKLENKQSNIRE